MVKVYTASELHVVQLIKSQLEERGVACVMNNEYSAIARGDLVYTDTWPEIWVDDDQAKAANTVLAELASSSADQQDEWVCAGCGEVIEGQFSDCWNCSQPRPEGSPKVL